MNPEGTSEFSTKPFWHQSTRAIFAQLGAIKYLLPVSVVLWCIAAWFFSDLYEERREAQVISQRYASAKISAESLSQNVEQELAIVRNVPVILAEDPYIVSQLAERFGPQVTPSQLSMAERNASWQSDPAFHALALRLQSIVDKVGLSSLFVMNAAGDCFAEGHEIGNLNFTGANYFDREYFQQALSGKVGHQFAVGRITDFLALFYASPVVAGNKFMGAIGARVNLSHLFADSPEQGFFVTDDNGVIIFAKDADLKMKALPNAKVFDLSDHDRETRYKQKHFEIVALTPSGRPGNIPLVRWMNHEDDDVLAHQSVSDNIVTVYVLRDLGDVLVMRNESRWWFALTSIIGSLTILLISGGLLFIKVEREYRRQLLTLNETLATQAGTDALTGCANRRRFLDALRNERQRADRYEVTFSMLSLDLDHFKYVNDTYGHSTGDLVLQNFVAVVQKTLRPSDLLGRLGGEEFSILLPHTPAPEAVIIGERIRCAIESTSVHAGSASIKVTVSVGVSEWQSVDDDTVENVLARSDRALYAAKESGRNTVCVG